VLLELDKNVVNSAKMLVRAEWERKKERGFRKGNTQKDQVNGGESWYDCHTRMATWRIVRWCAGECNQEIATNGLHARGSPLDDRQPVLRTLLCRQLSFVGQILRLWFFLLILLQDIFEI
jgi:hypothetical protein